MMLPTDVDAIVARAVRQIARDAARNSLINPAFDANALRDALLASPEPTWILELDGSITAHLYGALLEADEEFAAWTGPDGYSYDHIDDLTKLVQDASSRWRELGVRQHFVWCLDEPERLKHWVDMGFSAFSTRATLELSRVKAPEHRDEFVVRRAEREDLATAYDLDEQLDRAQGELPEQRTASQRDALRRELRDSLTDPDNNHFVLEVGGRVVAQCLTFEAPPRRGSFPRTIFLSEVAVHHAYRRRGLARHLIDHALTHARHDGFEYCETQWRSSNDEAVRFWTAYGFTETYARLRRSV